MFRHDLLVIGSGPAGQRAAIQAAKLGKSAAIIEGRGIVGGVTVHTGTIPSKTLREAVLYLTGWTQRGLYGQSYRLKQHLTMDDLMQRLEITIRNEVGVIEHQLTRNGVHLIKGWGSFLDPHRVQVATPEGQALEYIGEKILIATGTSPLRPSSVPFDDATVIDSDGILKLKKIPRSMTVIGAGVIGIEYASIFSAMDVEVTVVDGRTQMLEFLDREIVDELAHELRSRGVTLRLGEKVASIENNGSRATILLESGKRFNTELVMYAAGRIGSVKGLNLENAGLKADDRGRIKVNGNYTTDMPHIYAAGDVIGFPSLASTSMEQGRVAACHAFGKAAPSVPEYFPFGIYSIPEISMVGATEQDLTGMNVPYEVGTALFRETARGQILRLEDGMLKLLFGLEDRRLLGVHIIGEGATELVHIGQAVMALGGTLDYLVNTVFNYPTLAETYKIAALDAWNRMPD
ncbi:MAG TPA: Si-specific NAD(P)(+) transhydrogenase [Novimethylophilus sp.]|jgi:NAD(P) transhydrogenase|uniref:Si-specific NAD(P)(+) transhydrogenase n=1 Tax=Novimethylophilus sp. TaxID=2137426 RepID=UPI002F41B676